MATGTGSTPLRFLWQAALRRPWWVVGMACVAVPWLALAARNLRLEASIDLLSPKDPLAVADRERREIFGEDFRILLGLFKSEHEGGVLGRPSREALADLHRALEALPGVEAVSSLVNARALVASAPPRPGLPCGRRRSLLSSAAGSAPRSCSNGSCCRRARP